MKTNFWSHWLTVCGILIATGTAVPTVNYLFAWKAGVDAAAKAQSSTNIDTKDGFNRLDTKIDKLSSDTSEIKGTVKTLLEIQRQRQPDAFGPDVVAKGNFSASQK
jgi:hypothetical protein